ncbi:hypothetical protein F5Y08DRAFT_350281 [Xylaria arbuscula]|nr:hypothetical protein F5Y08DRAFT_350281 [Xylaria arbuscula]
MSVEDIAYTAKEVALHNKPANAWIIVHGHVYDLSSYIQDHPGGAEVLIDVAGEDASAEFDNAGHSDDAFEIMAAYRIGKLQGGSNKKVASTVRLSVGITTRKPIMEKNFSNIARSLGVVTAAVLGTAGLYWVTKQQGSFTALSNRLMFKKTQKLGFLEGFLIASTAFCIANAMVSRRLITIVRSHQTLNHPPHIKLPKRVTIDILNQPGWLHTTTFQNLPLVKKDLVAPNTYRLLFDLPSPLSVLGLPIGQHLAITANVGGQKVTRSYTPISNNTDRGRLDLLIKCYPDGKLSGGYLANLSVGDEVQFRGPKGAMRYKRGYCKRIGMLAGGTGITPMYQLIRAICEDEQDTTQISLIYANRTEADILLRTELEVFARKYPNNLRLYYMLDNPSSEWQGGKGFVTKEILAKRFPAADTDSKAMICGPPGMVNAAKTALVELGFEKSGAMSKMSDQIFCF